MDPTPPAEIARNSPSQFYHERQRLQLCALHSINNLFQRSVMRKSDLDAIVQKFDKSWCFNEYSTVFTGNYDLTIILEALKSHGYTLRAIDANEPFESFNLHQAFGLLLNKALDQPFFERLPLIRRWSKPARHWFVIKRLDGENYYDLDSKLAAPRRIGNEKDLIEYLNQFDRKLNYFYLVIEESQAELFQR